MAKQKTSKFSEDWVPVKAIQNGMIILNNNYYVTGIKVEPKNIFILDYQTQNNIIFNLRNFYNTLDYEFWLVVADRPVDIKLYLSQLQLQYDNAQNQAVRKLINQDIQKPRCLVAAVLMQLIQNISSCSEIKIRSSSKKNSNHDCKLSRLWTKFKTSK